MASASGDHSQSALQTHVHENEGNHIIDDFVQLISQKVNTLSDLNRPCICNIPKQFLEVNANGYTPYRVAIGPYHANAHHLKPMEPYKLRSLQSLMSRSWNCQDDILRSYVDAIQSRESEARRYYNLDNIQHLDSQTFKTMLLLDGSFIVELFCSLSDGSTRTNLIDGNLTTIGEVCQDLLYLENQIPFFILDDIFKCTFKGRRLSVTFAEIAYSSLGYLCPFISCQDDYLSPEQVRQITSQETVMHLLHLIRICCCLNAPTLRDDPSHEGPRSRPEVPAGDSTTDDNNATLTTPLLPSVEGENRSETSQTSCFDRVEQGVRKLFCLPLKLKSYCGRTEDQNVTQSYVLDRHPVTELHGVGIKFRPKKGRRQQPMEIEFDEAKGVLEMSHLRMDDYTEIFFRNVIAYEQYYLNEFDVTSYMSFMSGMINTKKDVDILEANQLIHSMLNSNEDAAIMFNNITKYNISDRSKIYKEVYDKLKDYTMNPCKKWIAMLYREYFHSPWAIISLVVAAVVLTLTILQTFLAFKMH